MVSKAVVVNVRSYINNPRNERLSQNAIVNPIRVSKNGEKCSVITITQRKGSNAARNTTLTLMLKRHGVLINNPLNLRWNKRGINNPLKDGWYKEQQAPAAALVNKVALVLLPKMMSWYNIRVRKVYVGGAVSR